MLHGSAPEIFYKLPRKTSLVLGLSHGCFPWEFYESLITPLVGYFCTASVKKEAHLEQSRTSIMEFFAKIVNGSQENSIIDVRLGSKYTSDYKFISNLVSDLKCEVELLILAHHCFTIRCEVEGIASVLRAARFCGATLSALKQQNLMVRLLIGIGRFRDMFDIIESLYSQHHFEILIKKGLPNVS